VIDVGFLAVGRRESPHIRTFARDEQLARRFLDRWRDDDADFLVIGRLHHRDDAIGWLRRRTRARFAEAVARSDAALCAALHRAAGAAGLRRLEGEFTVVGIDRRTQRLLAVRDPLGKYPCFWTSTGTGALVASSLRALADHLPELRVDRGYLADLFALARHSYGELPTEHTVYQGIQRLRPGCQLGIDLQSGVVQQRVNHEWDTPTGAAAATSLQTGASLVREVLEDAVAERVRASVRVACHVSGGMDSSGLALLTNRLLLERGQDLEAVSLVYEDDPVQAHERQYLELVLAAGRGVRSHRRRADELVEFADHERMPIGDEPSPMVADFRRIEVLLEAAQEAGADTVLTGDGGDTLFAHPPAQMVAWLLRRGHVRRAVALARAAALGRSDATSEILLAACRSAVTSLPGGRRRPLPSAPAWLSRDFADQQAVPARIRSWEASERRAVGFTVARVPGLGGDWYHWHLAVPRGLVQTNPFFDARLIALVAALPEAIAMVATPMKPVLATALADLLPGRIVERRRKGHFNTVLAGFDVHRDWLRRVIWEAPDPDGIIDRQALDEAVSLASMGVFEDAPAANQLSVAIAYLTWAASRPAWRAKPLPYLNAGASLYSGHAQRGG